jgi:glycosyltransferase involved in cell wall biosynthesis
MSAMRVLHVDPERAWGGGEVQVLLLCRALAARGVEQALAAHPGGPLARAAAAAGVPVLPLRIRNAVDVVAGLRLRRLAAGFDVVHFHTARAHALAPLVPRRGRRLVVTRRMDYVPRGGAWARWLYTGAVDAVIAISAGVRDALVRGGVPAERIRIVPSGVDADALAAPPGAREALRAEWGVPDDAVLVVLVGALERRKGHDVLLAAAARASARLRYAFVGTGSLEPALRTAAAPLGDRVVFAGFRDDVAACLAAADVAVLPSRHEGLGVAALEAMAAGRPVIASRTGGLAEVVVDGETGLLVPPEQAAPLATALDRLAADAALRARFGAAGSARVRAQYGAEKMAEETLACYGRAPCRG